VDRRALAASKVETLSAGLQLIHTNERGGAIAGWSAGAEARASQVNGKGSSRLYTEYVTNQDGSVDSRNYDLHGGTEARLTGSVGFNVGTNGVLTLTGAAGQRYMNNGDKLDTVSGGIRIDTPTLYAGVDVTAVGNLSGGRNDIPTQTQVTGVAGYRFRESGVRVQADFKATHINGDRGGKVAKEGVGSVVVPFNYVPPSGGDQGPDWKQRSQDLNAQNFMSMPTLGLGTDPRYRVSPAPAPVAAPTTAPIATAKIDESTQDPKKQTEDEKKKQPETDPKKPEEPKDPKKPEDPKKQTEDEKKKQPEEDAKKKPKEVLDKEQKNEYVLKKYQDPKTGLMVQESVVEEVTHYQDGTTKTKYVGYVQVNGQDKSFAKEYDPQWAQGAASSKPTSAAAWVSNPKALPSDADLRKIAGQPYSPGNGYTFTPDKWAGGGSVQKPIDPVTSANTNFGKGQSNFQTGQGDSNFGKGQSNYTTQMADNGQGGKQSGKRK
jgi:hypothetical protein